VDIESGTITTDRGIGISVDAVDAATRIVSGSVTTTDTHATAIEASEQYSTGISIRGASGQSGATSIVSNDLHTRGGQAVGIAADTAGRIAIESKLLQTDGDVSTGISAASQASDVSVVSDRLITRGIGSTGISVSSRGGNISITANSTTTLSEGADLFSSAAGIVAQSVGDGSITISSNELSTAGINAVGIAATGNGPIRIDSGSVTTKGQDATGIYARSSGSDITIDAKTTAVSGLNATAISALAIGSVAGGSVKIAVSGVVESTSGSGIFARAAGEVAIDIGADARVSGETGAIDAAAGSIRIVNAGRVAGDIVLSTNTDTAPARCRTAARLPALFALEMGRIC
jgi:hypothetical protein